SGRVYGRLIVLQTLPGILLIPVMIHVIHVNPSHLSDLRNAWLITLAAGPAYLLTPLTVLLYASQRGYIVAGLHIGRWVIVTALSVFLAWAGWGIMGQSVATSIGLALFFLCVAAVCYAAFPGVLDRRLFREPIDPDVRGDISRFRGPRFILNACSR